MFPYKELGVISFFSMITQSKLKVCAWIFELHCSFRHTLVSPRLESEVACSLVIGYSVWNIQSKWKFSGKFATVIEDHFTFMFRIFWEWFPVLPWEGEFRGEVPYQGLLESTHLLGHEGQACGSWEHHTFLKTNKWFCIKPKAHL